MAQWIEFDPDQVVSTSEFSLLGQTIRLSTVMVDGSTAKELLKLNVHNRNVSRKVVEQMKRDIAGDKWVYTGDAVRISNEGVLIDAQHRLIAIEEIGARVPVLIVEGLDPRASDWIDQNRKRSVPDILRFRDVHLTHVTTCAGAASILLQADLNIPATREMVADYVQDHAEELQRVAQWAKTMCDDSPVAKTKTRINSHSLSPSPLTALVVHMLRQGANAKLVQEFIEGVATGMSRTEEDKVTYMAMRRRIQDVPLFSSGGGQHYPVLLTEGYKVFINTYNAWVDGKVVKIVRSTAKGQRELIRSFSKLPKVNNRQSRPGTFSIADNEGAILAG